MAAEDEGEKSWSDYRRLVLAELERVNRQVTETNLKIDALRDGDLSRLKVEVAMLKVKASIAGTIGGAIVATIVSVMLRVAH